MNWIKLAPTFAMMFPVGYNPSLTANPTQAHDNASAVRSAVGFGGFHSWL